MASSIFGPRQGGNSILDEHMSALQVVQPREYDSVMEKIRYLR